MRRLQGYLFAALAIAAMSTAALAQQAAKPQDVTAKIPSTVMGFAVVNNLSDAGAKVDKFITDIGLREMVQGNVLEMLKTVLMIQQGVNENGGLAVCVLDPAQYGWDIPKMISTEEKEESPGPFPVAILIPGNAPMDIFANYQPAEDEGYVKVVIEGEENYAKAFGDYTVFAASKQLVDGVINGKLAVTTKMSDQQKEMVAKADIGVYVDMKMLAPIIVAAMDRAEKDMPTSAPSADGQMPTTPFAGLMEHPQLVRGYLDFYRGVVTQLDAAAVSLRFAQTGLLLEEMVSFKADSKFGKIIGSIKTPSEPLLNKLPALPYVLAIGSSDAKPAADSPEMQELTAEQQKFIDTIFGEMKNVPPDAKTKLKDAMKTLSQQAMGSQIYAGGATPDKGVFGVSVAMKVKEVDPTRAAIADIVDAVMMVVQSQEGQADKGKFAIKYNKDALKVEGASSVDTIDIEAPIPADQADQTTKVLGEEKIRMYVAAVDGKMVVLTFGGAEPFLAEAIKAARNGGPIGSEPEVVAALKELPQNPAAVILFNPSNLLEAIKTGHRIIEGTEMESFPWSMINLKSKAPIAVGVAISGPNAKYSLYIPTALVAETVQTIMQMQGGGPATGESAPGGSSQGGDVQMINPGENGSVEYSAQPFSGELKEEKVNPGK